MRVQPAIVDRYPIVLPPQAEQERIAKRLDIKFERLHKAQAAIARAQTKLVEYRTTLLEEAVTGVLTLKWREKHSPSQDKARRSQTEPTIANQSSGRVPKSWSWLPFEQLIRDEGGIAYGVLKPGPNVDNGVPLVRIKDIRVDGSIESDGLMRISRSLAKEFKRTELEKDDLLFSIMGTVGRIAIVPKYLSGANVNRAIAVIKLSDRRIAPYLCFALQSPSLQRRISSAKQGSAQQRINLSDLKLFSVPVPPVDEQRVIVKTLRERFQAIKQLEQSLKKQLNRILHARQALLDQAFSGKLVKQVSDDEDASHLLTRMAKRKVDQTRMPRNMKRKPQSPESLLADTKRISIVQRLEFAAKKLTKRQDANTLFKAAGLAPDQVEQFYEAIQGSALLRKNFMLSASKSNETLPSRTQTEKGPDPKHHFRLVSIWLENFKNLQDYHIDFDREHAVDVVLGWNGTGKSNLFESLVIIFRDLHAWSERNAWPDEPLNGFKIRYEASGHDVTVEWLPKSMKRPKAVKNITNRKNNKLKTNPINRSELPLPYFVFGYYSGPTNRLAEHFLPMKQAHYERLRKAKIDNSQTLTRLLAQRRFFCAETRHAKYVLLAFSYKEDPQIDAFLKARLRIEGFQSALFIIRKPDWAKDGKGPQEFWGAEGIMLRVMERLRRFAIAPLILRQPVLNGYRRATEEHYYFFLPDLSSLHAFASEYADARSFFLALESTDFSELIHDLKIQVRVKTDASNHTPITFHQMSEGEQQLLMVLGLLRFTKSHQSLILLDEPDTHLNPHWSIGYLKDLTKVMGENDGASFEQQSSQILMATHDPLVVASLVKEQVHLLKRDEKTERCSWSKSDVDPRGMGFTGILTSDMFGFRSDLDPDTLADLDDRVRMLATEDDLTTGERAKLQQIDKRLQGAGFSQASSDPYFAAFQKAWGARHQELMAGKQFLSKSERAEIDKIAREVLEEAVSVVNDKTSE